MKSPHTYPFVTGKLSIKIVAVLLSFSLTGKRCLFLKAFLRSSELSASGTVDPWTVVKINRNFRLVWNDLYELLKLMISVFVLPLNFKVHFVDYGIVATGVSKIRIER